jgi:hypothetical protein
VLTYLDIESSYMVGQAKFEKWRDEWEAKFLGPLVEAMLRQELVRVMTPEKMEMLYLNDRESFDKLSEFIGAGGK